MIGDFTGFFDHLDHQYLKQQWCSLLETPQLPADHYAVFKNITKYSIWELTDLLEINGFENNTKGRRQLNSLPRVLTKEQYHANKSHIVQNPNRYGIPQGSPISALLANVYMLDIDKVINEIAIALNGMYMRYSDDFIIVLPGSDMDFVKKKVSDIKKIFNETAGLDLQSEKTQYYLFKDETVTNCGIRFDADADCSKKYINFLGFLFDGKKVSIHSKTTMKYYYRMRRKARTIVRNGGIYG